MSLEGLIRNENKEGNFFFISNLKNNLNGKIIFL